MMDGNWDLDIGLMQDAHYLIKSGKVRIQELDYLVLAYQEGAGWLAWRFAASSDTSEDNSKKMIAFKDTLTKMGKESLFWRWQEIVEKERDTDGGFGPDAQERVAVRVTGEFKKEGLDFEEIMGSVGGVRAMPDAAR